jgi:hypothetical protein
MTRTEYSVLKEEIEDNECGWSKTTRTGVRDTLLDLFTVAFSSEMPRSGVLEEYAKKASPPGFLRIWRDGGPPPACDGPTTHCARWREEGRDGAPLCSSPSARPAAVLRACLCPALAASPMELESLLDPPPSSLERSAAGPRDHRPRAAAATAARVRPPEQGRRVGGGPPWRELEEELRAALEAVCSSPPSDRREAPDPGAPPREEGVGAPLRRRAAP